MITEQYIEQLNIDKNNLVDILINNEVEANYNETFTALIPKLASMIESKNNEINTAKVDLEELVTLEEETE